MPTISSALERQATQLFAQVMRLYLECDDDVQQIIRDMIEIVNSPESEAQEREMAISTICEALAPQYDEGSLGIDLVDAEDAAAEYTEEGRKAITELDREEATFAERVAALMQAKGISQVELAEKTGVQQSAISMMLSRTCRPQKRTVRKIAEALGIAPEDLFPA